MQATGSILQGLAANVAFVCEAWERPGHLLHVPGYEWQANPRIHINRRQQRGSAVVGFFIKSGVKDTYNGEVVDNCTDSIVALMFMNKSNFSALVIGVYIPL